MDSDNAPGGALDQLGGVLGECEKGATGFDHNRLSEDRVYGSDMASTRIAFYWPDGRVPELASTPEKFSRARSAAANGLGAGEIPRLARKAHNVAAGSSR
jgi:hypothetical protein